MNPLGDASVSRQLQRQYDLTGQVRVALDGTIVPVSLVGIDVHPAYHTNRLLQGELGVTALAGQTGYAGLWLPAGTNTRLYVNAVTIRASAATIATLNQHNNSAGAFISAGTFAGMSRDAGDAWDPLGNASSPSHLTFDNNSPPAGFGILCSQGIVTVNQVYQFQGGPWIVTAGRALFARCLTNALAYTVNFNYEVLET